MQSYAVVTSAQNKRLSLSFENSTLKEVLQKLEDETEFSFIYKDEQINSAKRVTENFRDEKVTDLLTTVLKKENMTYMINGRVIVILPNDSGASSSQQQKSVSGKVTDQAGATLPGASVVVKGTTKGVVTDSNGNYAINIPDGAILVFSFIGMKSLEVPVGKKVVIDVTMLEENIGVDEVVVVGYGVQKKVNVIGSIAQMSSKQLTDRPVVRLSNALTGGMSGVTVISRNGKPGSGDGQIRVRGVGSFGAEPSALIVVDGVPLVSISAGDLAPQASEGQESQPYGGATSGDINSINPNDIESVSVLKDAASAAIYGSRAANGVILITTKKGKTGKARINYNSYVGIQNPTATPRMANSVDYANAMNRATANTYTAQQIETLRTSGPSNNWIDQVLSGSGFTQQHNVSIVGGQKSNNYFVSF